MIGTLLWMLRLRMIRPASRKLRRVLRGIELSEKKKKKRNRKIISERFRPQT